MPQKNKTAFFLTNVLAGIGYIGLPWEPIQWGCLCFLGYRLLQQRALFLQIFLFLMALVSYSSAFFLNPVAFFYVPINHPDYLFWGLLGSGVSLSLGFMWFALIFPKEGLAPERQTNLPSLVLVLFWSFLLLVLYGASWKQDLAYLGDEVFHIISVQTYWVLLLELFQNSGVRVFLALWLILGILLFRLTSFSKSQRLFCFSGLSFLFLFLIPLFGYSEELFQMLPFLKDRVARYPATQPFFSAFLGSICAENWNRWIFSNEISRLLPFLALFFLGISLVSDSFFKKQPLLFSVLFLLFVATTPTLLYHGTILYLELPMVLLMTFLIQHRKLFLWHAPKRIYRTPASYLVFFLGFTKETVFPFLVLFFLLRVYCRLQRQRRQRYSLFYFLKAEISFAFAVFLPFMLYLSIRMYFQMRPYTGEWSNWFDVSLWSQSIYHLAYQFGGLWIFVFFQILFLFTQQKRFDLGFFLFLFLGTQFFLLGDSAQHVGLARFNLTLLPLALSFGQEGFRSLFQKTRKGALFFLMIAFGFNSWLAPIHVWTGDRQPWGKSDEQWYPYQKCFEEILKQQPKASILLGNMPMPYGTTVVTQQLQWIPTRLVQQPPLVTNDPQKNLESTLLLAQHYKFDVVLYREEKMQKTLQNALVLASFRLKQIYSTNTGQLYYFQKIK